MSSFLGLGFLSPWALVGLLVLPAVWWLLRLSPPTPKRAYFPALRILKSLRVDVETAERSPPWLLLLRLLVVTCVILALSQPIYNLSRVLDDNGRLVLIIDNGWASVDRWSDRQALALSILDEANQMQRSVSVIATADQAQGGVSAPNINSATKARGIVEQLTPKPWAVDRDAIVDATAGFDTLSQEDDVIWISDGLGDAQDLTSIKTMIGRASLVVAGTDDRAASGLLLRPPAILSDRLTVTVERGSAGFGQTYFVKAIGTDGEVLARADVTLDEGVHQSELDIIMPPELRNRLDRLIIEGSRSAAAQVLIDERWRRRPVGLVGAELNQSGSPLLKELYYLNRALDPITDIRIGSIGDLLKRPVAVMVLADPGPASESDRQALRQWVEGGGLLVRFAGPKLAREEPGSQVHGLLPTTIKAGDRVLGGTLSWREPAGLGDFPAHSPFVGIDVGPDITVTRQVLARPSPDLAKKTWATLNDGTPLVTGQRLGQGWTVLVHTTANTDWSNLALSGTFVEMLERLVQLSQGIDGIGDGPPLKPLEVIDAFGRISGNVGNAKAIPADLFPTQNADAEHPPGFYGHGGYRRALNLSSGLALPEIIPVPSTIKTLDLATDRAFDFRPLLLTLAFVLLMIDFLVSLRMRGLLKHSAGLRASIFILGLVLVPSVASAQQVSGDPNLPGLEIKLAYMITGDPKQDALSENGLRGLSTVTRRRTAAELGRPVGVNPNTDEIVYYPLIYWPVSPSGPILDETGLERVRRYLRNGGAILFDTLQPGGAVASRELRRLSARLALPPLTPVQPDHVLTRSFYLLQEFPGRWSGGTLWVEPVGERKNDGVSPVIAGSHDWASAWAIDDAQRPLYPVVPGGERQREMAFRFGINLIMYALTGNYKGDQVHMLEIIKRLGQ